jgi:hypothetical protein
MNDQQEFKVRCLELVALMMGPQQSTKGETTLDFLNRFTNLANVIGTYIDPMYVGKPALPARS